MTIERLSVTNLRNLEEINLNLSSHLNVVYGDNGSGKTSFLEAIYLLHAAKSFRSSQVHPIIRYNQPFCTVFAACSDELNLGIRKSKRETIIKKNTSPLLSASELAETFPVILIYQDLFSIIDQGPNVRRKLLDWGVFHVEPAFKHHWKRYKRALSQRNNALKYSHDNKVIHSWDAILEESALELTRFRQNYLESLTKQITPLLAYFNLPHVCLSFLKGWKDSSLLESFSKTLSIDKKLKTTSTGPHRADLFMSYQNNPLKQAFSRGQKKLFLVLLKFAQAQLLSKPCVYLIDDLSSELDGVTQEKLKDYLSSLSEQVIVTALDKNEYRAWTGASFFQLKRGVIVSRET